MRKLLILAVTCLFSSSIYAQAQPNPDSVAYQNQRTKINDMLAARTTKFGQYDTSLSKHSGIFGMQTKKDIRRSNDILMDIVNTDNGILQETKVLLTLKDNQLNYRIYQQQTTQNKAQETQTDVLAYMNSINKLRGLNDQLKNQLQNSEKNESRMQLWLIIAIGVLIVTSILFVLSKRSTIKA